MTIFKLVLSVRIIVYVDFGGSLSISPRYVADVGHNMIMCPWSKLVTTWIILPTNVCHEAKRWTTTWIGIMPIAPINVSWRITQIKKCNLPSILLHRFVFSSMGIINNNQLVFQLVVCKGQHRAVWLWQLEFKTNFTMRTSLFSICCWILLVHLLCVLCCYCVRCRYAILSLSQIFNTGTD